MDPRTAATIIGEAFDANELERAWIERVIRWVLPRDEDPTPRVRTRTDFPAGCVSSKDVPK